MERKELISKKHRKWLDPLILAIILMLFSVFVMCQVWKYNVRHQELEHEIKKSISIDDAQEEEIHVNIIKIEELSVVDPEEFMDEAEKAIYREYIKSFSQE